ncbi:MAG: addiction module protein [Rhodomicrobium sp.]
MSERAKLITEQALALSVEERERLYETLLLSLQEGSEQDEAEFREEIHSRREAFLSGEMSARPFEDILRERPGK